MVPHPVPVPPGCPFTLAHIPFGIFSTVDNAERRVGVAIGDHVVDISVLEESSFLDDIGLHHPITDLRNSSIGRHDDLGGIAALPAQTRSQLRHGLQSWLGNSVSPLFTDASLNERAFVSRAAATMHRPFNIPNFTDFMCADVHVDNCSRLAGAATPPSHYAMPLGYNGRASSVVIDGEPVHRPHGMVRDPQTSSISFQQSQRVDFESEIGFFVSQPLPRGRTISADEASDYIFGIVLLNDWSARDVQFAEMTPLGPFNGKAFATSISPWVTTLDTLQGSKCASPAVDLRKGGSTGAAHLRHSDEKSTWDLEFEVSVSRPKSTYKGPLLTSRSNLRDLRWSPGQMVAHLASSGCGLSTGDLIGTGTISSPNDSPALRTLGCLLELTEGGRVPAGSSKDAELRFLEDGDVVAMSVWDSARTFGLAPLSSPLLGSQRDCE
ncbi:putative 2-hydroxyhepta-2,4-diene-1,7-dioate isomerase [Microdochium bolleyi]|uniref:Fumarylacetoacetase n=1 Tax=Microdochium bolleyi TaxID=196109 RepID=A0A136IPY6_9PEZI|nr:putative 2-hydroxyhepta-2,4-diene-1,7-dioate isomerase [Microdochium bolleyi]